jgi:2-oxoglutarate dehydrogenase E2 component (dihydrolipoamide succinyltransferase)
MIVEVKVPSPGESINEVELTTWLVKDGDIVTVDQEIAEIESDKATLSLNAVESGKISIAVPEGSTVKVGSVACTIDTDFAGEAEAVQDEDRQEEETASVPEEEKKVEPQAEEKSSEKYDSVKVTPLAKKVMEEENISIEDVINGLKRLTTKDVEKAKEALRSGTSASVPEISVPSSRDIERKKMSQLRKKLAQRLVSVKNETAMLTTFNEVDMSAVIEVRKKYQPQFVEKHSIKLGFMSFFIKASALALKQFPMVNSMIDGEEILTPQYVDVSIAVQTPKGLLVPVIRNAETLTLAQIETELKPWRKRLVRAGCRLMR